MGYVGPRLADWFSDEDGDLLAYRSAVKLTDQLHEKAVLFTPVDTGNLRTNWHTTPVRRRRGALGPEYHGSARNNTSYAMDVDQPTGTWRPGGSKYPITAKSGSTLSWITKKPFVNKKGEVVPVGTRVYAKRVMHPGSKGHYMAARACAYVEATADLLLRPELGDFTRRVERRIIATRVNVR